MIRAFLEAIRSGAAPSAGLSGQRTGACEAVLDRIGPEAPLRRSSAEQSNTSIRVGDAAILKGIRKLEPGMHPELEMSRFLTEVAKFPNTPPLLGWVERTSSSGNTTLCVLQGLVQGAEDGWSRVTGRLSRRVTRFDDSDAAQDQQATALLRLLGRRTAELHRALATPGDDPAFTPEPATRETVSAWADGVRRLARRVMEQSDPKRIQELVMAFDPAAPRAD